MLVNADNPVPKPLVCCLQNKQRFKLHLLCPRFVVSSCFVYECDVMYCGVYVTHESFATVCSLLQYACWGGKSEPLGEATFSLNPLPAP